MSPSRHWLALLLATAFAGIWLALVGFAAASARLPPATSGWVLAVFPPALDSAAVSARIIDAGGFPLESRGVAFAWTAYSPAAGFVGRLEEQGAMLVVPPLGELRFSGLCGAGMELLSARATGTAGLR